MANIKIVLTDEHLQLISNIHFEQVPEISEKKPYIFWGIDFNSLYGGSFLFEDIAYLLGVYDKHIEGTEEDPMGPKFPIDLEDHMYELHCYIVENIGYIENLVHYYSNKGGLKPGVYTCKDYQLLWTYKES